MNDHRKDCPFCGGASKLEETYQWGSHTWWKIYCIQCGAGWKHDDFPRLFATKDEALDAWNKRPEEKKHE